MGRLIDEDSVMKKLTEVELNNGTLTDAKIAMRDVPTAYDVEKVLEQLQEREETSKEYYVEAMVEGIYSSVNRFCGERFAYNNAIELVRKGGAE